LRAHHCLQVTQVRFHSCNGGVSQSSTEAIQTGLAVGRPDRNGCQTTGANGADTGIAGSRPATPGFIQIFKKNWPASQSVVT